MPTRRQSALWLCLCVGAGSALACGLALEPNQTPGDGDDRDPSPDGGGASSGSGSGGASSSGSGSGSGASSSGSGSGASSSGSGGASSGTTPLPCAEGAPLGPFEPVSIASGLTHDVVADAIPAAQSASAFGIERALFSQSYLTALGDQAPAYRPLAPRHTQGAHTFDLQPFDQTNVLRIPAVRQGRHPLGITPTATRALSLLMTSVYGDAMLRVTLKYDDGTEDPAQALFVPRFATTTPAPVHFTDFDQVWLDGRNNAFLVSGSPTYLHALDLIVPATNCAKRVSGLEFERVSDSADPNHAVFVFAVSAAQPTP